MIDDLELYMFLEVEMIVLMLEILILIGVCGCVFLVGYVSYEELEKVGLYVEDVVWLIVFGYIKVI